MSEREISGRRAPMPAACGCTHQSLHTLLHLLLDAGDARDADQVDEAVRGCCDLLHALRGGCGRGQQHQLQAVAPAQLARLVCLLQRDIRDEQPADARSCNLGNKFVGAAAQDGVVIREQDERRAQRRRNLRRSLSRRAQQARGNASAPPSPAAARSRASRRQLARASPPPESSARQPADPSTARRAR